ncbi:hypothetical protein SDC9_63869 [bioreactor metagenome]|uniref:Uncharacterized protein n=1 Tax=bioreactor metagenome TaxID=1076179 RepID=A0A644XTN5_9ZZZZ
MLRELDGSLSAERDDDPVRLFRLDDVHHVLRRERLEIQPVGCIEVRRDRFRVVVDDDHLEARALKRPDAVHGSIVELDALADANRPRTEHDYAALAGLMPL